MPTDLPDLSAIEAEAHRRTALVAAAAGRDIEPEDRTEYYRQFRAVINEIGQRAAEQQAAEQRAGE